MEPSSNEAWFLHPVTREGEDHILYHLIITLLLGISSTFTQGTGYLMSTKASEHPAVICPSSPQVINIAKKVFLFTFKVCKWMPKNAAWFLSGSWASGWWGKDSISADRSGWPPPSPRAPQKAWAPTSQHTVGLRRHHFVLPRMLPSLPQPRKLFILGSATKKISVHLFGKKRFNWLIPHGGEQMRNTLSEVANRWQCKVTPYVL